MKIETYTSLLPYQEQAVEKLRHLKIGALYMEMGTGKTRTALELIKLRVNSGKVSHVIWLCPCNIKADIQRGIAQHSNLCDLGILDIVGIETLSTSIRECSRLLGLVKKERCYLIVDESSLVKNHAALRTIHIQQLAENCAYKLILSGTPISRNEADLYAQWYILDWRILGYKSYYSFSANHLEYYTVRLPSGAEIKTDQIKRVLNVDYLTEKIAPYTYQTKKSEQMELPKKRYHVCRFSLTDSQKIHYENVKDTYLCNVDDFRNETIYKLFTALQRVSSGRTVLTGPLERMQTQREFKNPIDNPRIQCLMNDALSCVRDEKVIIFCKYQDEVDEIGEALDSRNIQWVPFTGKTLEKQRQKNLENFRSDVQIMISNKSCGAFGLNLQFCHNVIFYDNDFDFATRAQAEDRVHRIGQTEEVNIYDICADNTIDAFIAENLTKKSNMLSAFRHYIAKLRGKKYDELKADSDRAESEPKGRRGKKIS